MSYKLRRGWNETLTSSTQHQTSKFTFHRKGESRQTKAIPKERYKEEHNGSREERDKRKKRKPIKMSCQRISRFNSLLQYISHNTTTSSSRAFRRTPVSYTSRFARTSPASFHTSPPTMAQRTLDSQTISEITHKENELTGQPEPAKEGPTAQAQKHASDKLSAQRVSEIAKGEETITRKGGPVPGGPAAFAQSEAAQARNAVCIFVSQEKSKIVFSTNQRNVDQLTYRELYADTTRKTDTHGQIGLGDHLAHYAGRVGTHGPAVACEGRPHGAGAKACRRAH